MSTDEVIQVSATGNPVETAKGVVQGVAESVRQGLITTSNRLQQAIPVAADTMTKATYTAGYCLSYGVCFPVFLLYNIPGVPALSSGMVDGAKAAREYATGLRKQGSVS